MRKLLLALLILPRFAFATTQCVAFQDTDGYCTGSGGLPANTFVAATPDGSGASTNDDLYVAGVSSNNGGALSFFMGFGATPAADSRRDRTTANCSVGLAGMMFYTNNTTDYYEFTMDIVDGAGNYDFAAAIGDPSSTDARPEIKVYDNTTLLATIGTTATLSSGHFLDANGVDHATAAAWNSSNTPLALTFATSTLKIRIGRGDSSSGDTRLSRICLTPSASSVTRPTSRFNKRLNSRFNRGFN